MAGAWLREEQADLAALKILDGAAQAFVELGVTGAGMGEIARYAGCSRAPSIATSRIAMNSIWPS